MVTGADSRSCKDFERRSPDSGLFFCRFDPNPFTDGARISKPDPFTDGA
jgi:hypothetical protein